MRRLRLAICGLVVAFGAAAQAQAADRSVTIGVLNDQSGLYADMGGVGSVVAARLAVEDSGLPAKGWKIEVISADHQNKTDVAATIARRWYDIDGVDMITDVTNSSVALAVSQLTKDKNKVMLASGPATSDLTGKACTPNTIHWTHDTWALANSTAKAALKVGGDTWYFITADYAFGHALERDTEAVVTANGGKVVGRVRHPINNTDFSSFLVQAQSSKAKIVAFANSGADTSNSINQAAEFGLVAGGQKLAGLLVYLTDVHSLGLELAQGLVLASPFYWDADEGTRAFSKRFEEVHGKKPTMVQAGVYSATLHYLKAVAEAGNAEDGADIVKRMKAMPTDDPLFGKGSIREDGRKIHPIHLYEVKTPAESKQPWDYYKHRATVAAEEAFRPLKDGECPMVTH
ncbi:ABC transporter substrate-binding protein [Microvirga massiliensis]|uniref:ABC transporter substrate-binding protein n=1 Tax=Microvirga massiliensis TaxID=1033741 RepID=UPI00062B8C5F|nr:ABC transporter substrate-binding protein [Microvirga massiliensis]